MATKLELSVVAVAGAMAMAAAHAVAGEPFDGAQPMSDAELAQLVGMAVPDNVNMGFPDLTALLGQVGQDGLGLDALLQMLENDLPSLPVGNGATGSTTNVANDSTTSTNGGASGTSSLDQVANRTTTLQSGG